MRGLPPIVASGGHSSSRCAGLSLSQPLLLRSTGSRRTGSVVVAHGPTCSAACGIFPDQGSNPCPLHWQADSQPLRHQGSPGIDFWSEFWRVSWSYLGQGDILNYPSNCPSCPCPFGRMAYEAGGRSSLIWLWSLPKWTSIPLGDWRRLHIYFTGLTWENIKCRKVLSLGTATGVWLRKVGEGGKMEHWKERNAT